MLNTSFDKNVKIDWKEHLETKVKDQPSSDATSNFVVNTIANAASI